MLFGLAIVLIFFAALGEYIPACILFPILLLGSFAIAGTGRIFDIYYPEILTWGGLLLLVLIGAIVSGESKKENFSNGVKAIGVCFAAYIVAIAFFSMFGEGFGHGVGWGIIVFVVVCFAPSPNDIIKIFRHRS